MSKKLKEIAEEEFKMEMTPMIDVTFLLLIFFLLTIKFKILEGKLSAYLPKDIGVNTSQADPVEKVEILIRVVKAGRKLSPYLDGKPYDPDKHKRFEYDSSREVSYQIGPEKTDDIIKVAKRLKDLFGQDEERPVTIDCRAGVVYGDMVPVLDVAIDAGFTEITFVGEYK
jgi:biopolymer transport protein ExbD